MRCGHYSWVTRLVGFFVLISISELVFAAPVAAPPPVPPVAPIVAPIVAPAPGYPVVPSINSLLSSAAVAPVAIKPPLALPKVSYSYTGFMNEAVGNIIAAKLAQQGVSVARSSVTKAAVARGLTVGFARAFSSLVAPVSWPAVLVGVGLSALIDSATKVDAEGTVLLTLKDDGSVVFKQSKLWNERDLLIKFIEGYIESGFKGDFGFDRKPYKYEKGAYNMETIMLNRRQMKLMRLHEKCPSRISDPAYGKLALDFSGCGDWRGHCDGGPLIYNRIFSAAEVANYEHKDVFFPVFEEGEPQPYLLSDSVHFPDGVLTRGGWYAYAESVSMPGGWFVNDGVSRVRVPPPDKYRMRLSVEESFKACDKKSCGDFYPEDHGYSRDFLREEDFFESKHASVDKAFDCLSPSVASKELSSDMLTGVVNAAWRAAKIDSNSNSRAVIWSAHDPITKREVEKWISENYKSIPTVRDFVSAVAPAGVSSVSLSKVEPMVANQVQASASLSSNQVTPQDAAQGDSRSSHQDSRVPFVDAGNFTIGDGGDSNGGGDRNDDVSDLMKPILETTPSASSILESLLGLMPDLKDFQVPAHLSLCPTAEFCVFGGDYSINSHCLLIEQNRSLIESSCLVLWSLVALYIFLRA